MEIACAVVQRYFLHLVTDTQITIVIDVLVKCVDSEHVVKANIFEFPLPLD